MKDVLHGAAATVDPAPAQGTEPPVATDTPPDAPATSEAPESLTMPELVHRLHDGRIPAEELPADIRQACVAYLTDEGYSTSEIAQVMHVCERTIRRDRAAARAERILQPSLELGDQLLGEFADITHACVRRLTRLANDHNTPPIARLRAEEAMTRVYQRFIDTTHRLRYLATGGRRLQALYLKDHPEANPLYELEQLMSSCGGAKPAQPEPEVRRFNPIGDDQDEEDDGDSDR